MLGLWIYQQIININNSCCPQEYIYLYIYLNKSNETDSYILIMYICVYILKLPGFQVSLVNNLCLILLRE